MARHYHAIARAPVTYNQLGRVASKCNGWITLEDARDAMRFHIGMDLRAGVSADQLRSGTFRIVATDEENGMVEVAPPDGVVSFVAGDCLFWCCAEQAR
jgi:hypothetical protein